jgi:hypothetical protein
MNPLTSTPPFVKATPGPHGVSRSKYAFALTPVKDGTVVATISAELARDLGSLIQDGLRTLPAGQPPAYKAAGSALYKMGTALRNTLPSRLPYPEVEVGATVRFS